MPRLIKNGTLCDDPWTVIGDEDDIANNAIIPLQRWLTQRASLANRNDIGLWLDGAEDLEPLAQHAAGLPVIAIHFPAFMDGRGFSSARILRERYQFTGELRAIGNFIRDQLCYLRRCGFDAFAFNDADEASAALASLNDFTEYYQAGVDQPLPLFRRREPS